MSGPAEYNRPSLGRKGGRNRTEYRRKKDSNTWHWCINCSKWPTSDYVESYTKPTSGKLDNECKVKEEAGTCNAK